MGPTSTIRMTKPRIAAMVLEGTAALVSAILLGWLLLWFIHQTFERRPIEAYAVLWGDGAPPEATPLRAADVRFLSGTYRQARPSELLETIQGRLGRDGPEVIYVSATVPVPGPRQGPSSSAGDGASWIQALVEALCSTPGRDIVLAVEFAAIDTDRELGIFGNRAYWELEEIVNAANAATEPARTPKRRLFILTSAAPAQKSWTADGLAPAQSVFAYYLRKGLEGGERRGQDDSDAPRSIAIEELHRYVLNHVREWVFRYRGAVQTPMLLSVRPGPKAGPGPILTTIPARDEVSPPRPDASLAASTASADPGPPGAEGRPKSASARAPAAEKTGEKTDEVVDPKTSGPIEARLKALIAEWETHANLQQRRPYRLAPAAWRAYQAALLRTEKRLRAAWLDPEAPEALDRVDLGFEDVRDGARRIEERLDQKNKEASHFRFRPAAAEDEGKRRLQEALVFVTGQGLDLPELTPPSPPPTKAETEAGRAAQAGPPSGEAAKSGAPSGPSLGKEKAKESENEAPRGPAPSWLRPSTPEVYLELQLPAWAYRFTEAFQKDDYFRQDLRRRRMLLELVQARADAEMALSLDRRGLAWIEPALERGDRLRRDLQDRLLSGAPMGEGPERWKSDVDQVGWLYRGARERGQKFREAREVFEDAAANLPILAEWLVRDQSYALGAASGPSQPLPTAALRSLASFGRLAQLLDERPPADGARFDEAAGRWFGDLGRAAREAERDLEDLRQIFRRTVNGLASDNRWTTLDAVLGTPLIEPNQRALLLRKLRTFHEPPILHLRGPGAADDEGEKNDCPADAGFWARAAGLARLDLMLHRIARAPGELDDAAPGFKEFHAAWSLLKNGPSRDAGAQTAAPRPPDFGAAVIEGGKGLADFLEPPAQTGVAPRREEVEPKLPAKDRRARLIDAWKLEEARKAGAVDQPVEDYELFSRYAVLDFQFRRLREDFAERHVLADLDTRLKEFARALGFARGPAGLRDHGLRIRTSPEDTLQLIDWKGALTVEVPQPEEADGATPTGLAFAGLVVPPGLVVDSEAPAGLVPGQLVRVGASSSAERPTNRREHQLKQARYGGARPFPVKAVLFYRGRAEQDATRVVHVLPNEDIDLVSTTIGQDPKVWAEKYGEAARGIQDQFARHQHEGYTHIGKGLDFVLTFQNRTPSRIPVKCEIRLVDPSKPQPKKEDGMAWFTEEWTFGPAGADADTHRVSRSLPAMGQVPHETREMEVVLVSRAPQIDSIQKRSFKVVFRQQSVDEYMDFGIGFENPCLEHKETVGGPTSCMIVTFKRRADDKFTEPVAASEWRCEMPDRPSQTITKLARWIPVNKSYGFHFYNYPFSANPDGAWSGKVENEEVAGTQKGGGKKRKP